MDKMPEPGEQHRLEDKHITIECSACRKVLFESTEKEAKRLTIYCTDCCRKGGKKGMPKSDCKAV